MTGRGLGWVMRTLAAAAVVAVGCSDDVVDEGAPCAIHADCDDANPCTWGECADGTCRFNAFPDGDAPEQTPHDCQTDWCEGGKLATVVDPWDKPVDQPCSTYECVDMVLQSSELAEGAPCEIGGEEGTCTAEGACDPGCLDNAACDDGNACTINTCNGTTGACDAEPLNNVAAPGSEQVAGDCQQILCQDGAETLINDDTDLPDDGNDCTEELCTEGAPSNTVAPANTSCSVPNGAYEKVCDGQGTCVECNGPSQCDHLPADTLCGTRTCSAGVCGQDCVASNTATPGQQPGDCKTVVCDGSCGTAQIADAQDLPVDNNDCTLDICTGMTPSNPPAPVNTACGSQGTLYCNGSEICVGCTNSNQCPNDTFCRDYSCNQQQCVFIDTSSNTPLPSQDQTTGDCHELQCDGSGGIKSVNANDPLVDGNECTDDLCTNGTPQNPPVADGTACTGGQCLSGVCQ